jgi:hypothetical protein
MKIAGFLFFKKAQSIIKPIETLKGAEKSLKVPLRGTFKDFSGFYNSVKRCSIRLR